MSDDLCREIKYSTPCRLTGAGVRLALILHTFLLSIVHDNSSLFESVCLLENKHIITAAFNSVSHSSLLFTYRGPTRNKSTQLDELAFIK